MSKFKIQFFLDGDGFNLSTTKTLPFLPQIGMQIQVLKGDDFRKVDDVYWAKELGFQIFLEDEETLSKKVLLEMGWKEGI